MRASTENYFFIATAFWYLVTVFWGFAPSFYLLNAYEDAEPLPKHLIIHGILFSIWTVLYAVQVSLVSLGNIKSHQVLGILGVFVMILMVPTGLFPVVFKVYEGKTTIDGAGHNIFRLISAYSLFGLALMFRRKPFLHKRFMLGCMVMLMSAAIFRISFDFNMQDNQTFNKGFQILPAASLFLFDLLKYKKTVLIDLISVAVVFGIFYFADYFWLSSLGKASMDILIAIFVLPFV